ncbi:MAG: arylsulfatase [Bryobacterales bacterium]|nr:arylsulfatase [Bryobacterales bacterium]
MRISRRSFLSSAPVWAAASVRPNIVFVITDDQGYGDIGRHGNPVLKTPHMDALHDESLRLTNYHVSPTCAPTRSALLTGRYTNLAGPWHTIQGRSILHHNEITMADCFRAAGYRTGIFGKWHLGDNYPCRPQDRGFDETLVHGGGGIWQTPDHFGNDYFDDTYLHNGRPKQFEGFCTDVFFAGAREFIAASAGRKQPFFCYLSTNAPHGPMWAPEKNAARYENVKGLREPGFYGMIENIDENIGRLRAYLQSSGLAKNTIFIFTTDNGSASGFQVFNAGMRGNKGSAYDGGHRVPFFLHWPGGGYAVNRAVDTLTAHIDILPTLLEMAGARRPKGPALHGRSLVPLIKKAPWPARTIVTDSQREETLMKWRQAAVMTQEWRLVSPGPGGAAEPQKLELFDMRSDPGQRVDVASQHPDVVARLKASYEEWWTLVSARAGEYARIIIGDAKDNPAKLTAHDWHGDGALKTWNQRSILQGPDANGFWAVLVRAGRYRMELRRWPKEVGLALGAAYTPPPGNRETAPGRAIAGIERARIRIGAVDRTIDVDPAAPAAVFELELAAGPAELQTWLLSKDGSERGAYFLYAERL